MAAKSLSTTEVIAAIAHRIIPGAEIDYNNVWYVSLKYTPDMDLIVVDRAVDEFTPGFYCHVIKHKGWRFWWGITTAKMFMYPIPPDYFLYLLRKKKRKADGPTQIRYWDSEGNEFPSPGMINLNTVNI